MEENKDIYSCCSGYKRMWSRKGVGYYTEYLSDGARNWWNCPESNKYHTEQNILSERKQRVRTHSSNRLFLGASNWKMNEI